VAERYCVATIVVGAKTDFCVGAVLDLGRGVEREATLARRKVDAGADFFITQWSLISLLYCAQHLGLTLGSIKDNIYLIRIRCPFDLCNLVRCCSPLIQQILERYRVAGLLTVEWEVETTTRTRYRGRGRPGAQRETVTTTQVRYVIRKVQRNESAIAAHRYRLGWRAQVTNVPATQLSLAEAVVRYRGGWVLERDFHLVKDLPLGLSPLFVWKDDQIKALIGLSHFQPHHPFCSFNMYVY